MWPSKVQARSGDRPARRTGFEPCEAPRRCPTQLAPGVHRLGNALVNCYLIEDGNRMTLVDGGFPGFRGAAGRVPALAREQRRRDRRGDPHARHSDHVGMAEGVRRDAGVPVLRPRGRRRAWRARGKQHKREGSLLAQLWRPPLWKLLVAGAREGGAEDAEGHARSRRSPTATSTCPAARGSIPTPGPLPRPRRVPPARPRGTDRRRRAVQLQPAPRLTRPSADAQRASPTTTRRCWPRWTRSSA